MPTFIHAQCPCGRALRATPDQVGAVIHCWECGGEVVVPQLISRGELVRSMSDAASDTLRAPTSGIIFGGVLLLTATLLIPRVGPLLATGLVAAAVWAYGRLVRAGATGPSPGGTGADAAGTAPDAAPEPVATPRIATVARGILALAAALALVAPLLVRNRGQVLPPRGPAPGVLGLMALSFAGWLVMPLALAAAYAHDRHGPLPPRQSLWALARHPLATLSALLVMPLGMLALEGLLALIAWQQGQLPLMVVDLFPPPRSAWVDDGEHIYFDYDGAKFDENRSAGPWVVNRVYPRGLRRGFTLAGTIPASLSMGLLEVRVNPWKYAVSPTSYLAMRIFLTALILTGVGLLLTIQARWLGLIAATALRRPVSVAAGAGSPPGG